MVGRSINHDLVFETLWGRVLEAWDDEKAHAAVLDYAVRTHALAELAASYRALKDDPDKGPLAKKKMQALVVTVTLMLESRRAPKGRPVPWWLTMSATLVCALVVAYLTLALLHR